MVFTTFFEATLIVCALLTPLATAVGIVTHLTEKKIVFVLPYSIHCIWASSPEISCVHQNKTLSIEIHS
jgi:hypothetical protein